jgi:hypothetical protein
MFILSRKFLLTLASTVVLCSWSHGTRWLYFYVMTLGVEHLPWPRRRFSQGDTFPLHCSLVYPSDCPQMFTLIW